MFSNTWKRKIPAIPDAIKEPMSSFAVFAIYNIFVTEPNDVSILLPDDEQEREVTLITCSNGNKNRLIIKAKEVEN